MNSKAAAALVILLAIIIVVLAWFLFTTPAHAPTSETATSTVSTSNSATSTAPLDTEVTVTTPQSGASVSHTLTVSGEAPGSWFFEAQFPILVKDSDNETIGSNAAQAQTDWQTSALVPFTDTITIDPNYHGPATLVLRKDNPSGLPQNDDSVTVPIVVQ